MGVIFWNEEGAEHRDEFFMGNIGQRVVIDDSLLVGVSCEYR